jgi:Protein of unknown function (DUF3460)
MYESEITKFLKELKAQRPQLVEEQRKGRALLWDKPQDIDTSERNLASRIPMKAYPYQTK